MWYQMLTLESHFHGNSYVKFTWSKVVAAALFIHERQNVEHAPNNIKQSTTKGLVNIQFFPRYFATDSDILLFQITEHMCRIFISRASTETNKIK